MGEDQINLRTTDDGYMMIYTSGMRIQGEVRYEINQAYCCQSTRISLQGSGNIEVPHNE